MINYNDCGFLLSDTFCTAQSAERTCNIPTVGVGQERRYKMSIVIAGKKAAPATRATLKITDPVRWNLGSKRHRSAIARPNKLGTDSMAVEDVFI